MQMRVLKDGLGRPPVYKVVTNPDGSASVRNPLTGVSERIGPQPFSKAAYSQALHRLAAKEGTT